MAKAVVINLSNTTQHLYTHAGDSVSVLASNKSVPIDVKFIEWITPHPNVIRILHYIDDSGKQVDKLPGATPPVIPSTPAATETVSESAKDYNPKDFATKI